MPEGNTDEVGGSWMSYDMSMPFPLIMGIACGRGKRSGVNLGMIDGFLTLYRVPVGGVIQSDRVKGRGGHLLARRSIEVHQRDHDSLCWLVYVL